MIKHDTDIHLESRNEGLTLVSGDLELRADFAEMIPRLTRIHTESLVKAVRIKGLRRQLSVIDATAGLGEDSLILAAAGFKVTMYERNEIIARLVEDALTRAKTNSSLSEIPARMELRMEDSIVALNNLDEPVDVLFLDPMFPERHKSALVKKKFQLLQKLESPCDDEEALLEAAIRANPFKVVIKRPAKGPFLAGIKPSYQISGKAIRYDCLVFPENRRD